MPDEVIDNLISRADVLYCAGAIKIEDLILAQYIEKMDGTFDSTSVLPKKLLLELLDKCK